MFRLWEENNYSIINYKLKKFLKCSVCHRFPKRLRRVCENGHFFCERCTNVRKCLHCQATFTIIDNLTMFNSMLDVIRSTRIDSWEFIEKLVQLFECPICFEQSLTCLTICSRGHSVCRRCSLFINACPLCREGFIPQWCVIEIQRNLEDALLDIPCNNKANGCKVFSDYINFRNHIDKCRFVSWNCGEKKCSWSGIVESTAKHAKEFHPNSILKGKRIHLTLKRDNNLHLHLWNRKKSLDYKIFYKISEQGLKILVYCQKTKSEKVMLCLNYDKTSCYFVPCIEPSKNPSYFLTHECPTLLPRSLVETNKPVLECLLQVEEDRWQSVVIFIIKVAFIVIKLLTL